MRSAPRSEKALLAKYRAMRTFDATPEPAGAARVHPRPRGSQRFVVQKHAASHLHYDFRLEAEGVLKSWAVPKGPSLNAGDRRLAMQTEDHPLDYFDFEGVIPPGNYGAGQVIVWDWGTYETVDGEDPARAIARGKIKFRIFGQKLRGVFTLVRMHGKAERDRGWLLIHEHDDDADEAWDVNALPASVKTGHTIEQVAANPRARRWSSNRDANGRLKEPRETTDGDDAHATSDGAPAANRSRVARASASRAASPRAASATRATAARTPRPAARAKRARTDAARTDTAGGNASRANGARTNSAPANDARTDTARASAARTKRARTDAARASAARAERAPTDVARASAARTNGHAADGSIAAPAAAKRARARRRLPTIASPELATLIDAPFDDDAWLFEIKWDGFRALCTIHEDGSVELVSRNKKDLLADFPQLARLASSFDGAPLIVDGEIVALDEHGKSSFQRLQNRLGARPPRVTYVVFDVLYADGRDLRHEPLESRKAILERLVVKGSGDVLYSKHVVGQGRALFAVAEREGLEGIIAKRRDAPYAERRTRDWVKIKCQKTQEVVIAGWTEPSGSRNDFGSLVLGVHDHGQLVYAGNVGTGFTRASLAALMKKMKPLATDRCPFAVRPKTRTRAHWVEPKLVAQIRFTEWTDDGSMRHPAFLGLRDDKRPEECTREIPTRTRAVAKRRPEAAR